MKQAKEAVISFLVWAGCANIITATWRTLEIALYGEIQQRSVDTIITLLFSLTLWACIRSWWRWRR